MSKKSKVLDFKEILEESNKLPDLFQIMDETGKIVNEAYMPNSLMSNLLK
ncbi:hypothetical protein MGH68_06690 [Erysipelothrix sp. D19-032]